MAPCIELLLAFLALCTGCNSIEPPKMPKSPSSVVVHRRDHPGVTMSADDRAWLLTTLDACSWHRDWITPAAGELSIELVEPNEPPTFLFVNGGTLETHAALCTVSAQDAPRLARMSLGEATAAFRETFHRSEFVVFRGGNGRRVEGDADVELAFFEDGHVAMLVHGFALSRACGTYSVETGGIVTPSLSGPGRRLPAMKVVQAGDSLLLQPLAPNGPSSPGEGLWPWPFRSLGESDLPDAALYGRC
jgi:hypothetical protein